MINSLNQRTTLSSLPALPTALGSPKKSDQSFSLTTKTSLLAHETLGAAKQNELILSLTEQRKIALMEKELEVWILKGQDDEKRADAAGIILDCARYGDPRLDLSWLNLRTLPDCIGNLLFLEGLWAVGNELTELPESIGNLSSLYRLKVQENQLAKLPNSIVNLSSLGRFDLYQNKLTELPNDIGKLPSLERLILFSNQLKELPESIGNLQSLTRLDIDNNKLTKLPDRMDNLLSLKYLSVYQNPLKVLSETIRNLPAFKYQPRNEELLHLPTTLDASEPIGSSSSATPEIANTPPPQLSLTPDQYRRIAELLDTLNIPAHVTLTPEQHDRVIKVLSMEEAISAAVADSPVTDGKTLLLQPALEKLIEIAQITFANELEKRQWEAEIGMLMKNHPNTAAQGLLLYNLVSSGLTGQFNNTAYKTSGAAGERHGMATSVGATASTLTCGLNFVPSVGSLLETGAKTVVTLVDGKRITRNLNRGLHAMASIGNAGTLQQQQEAMARITHGVSYRLALHRCGKEPNNTSAVKQAIKTVLGIDDRSINNFQTYVQKITDAIQQPKTFQDADAEEAVTRLVTAALNQSALGNTYWVVSGAMKWHWR